MSNHLQNKHNKVVQPNPVSETNQRKLTEIFFGTAKKRKSNEDETRAHLQYIFNRQLTLWICRDLLPFNTVTKDGFIDFWNSTNHRPNLPLPCRATISVSALNDLYECTKRKLVNILTTAPEHATITFDCWTDSAKHNAYVTYTYHYMHDWSIRTVVLKTAMLSKPHTGERLQENFEEMIREYDLSSKRITVVTDGGSNVVKACRLMNISRFGCIAHILHNVITRDLMKNTSMHTIVDLMAHIRQVQRKLTYKHAELKAIYEAERQQELWSLLEEFEENGMITDIHCSYSMFNICHMCVKNNIYSVTEQLFDATDRFELGISDTVDNGDSIDAFLNQSNNFSGLISFNRIRWGCLLKTARSHLDNFGNFFSIVEFNVSGFIRILF